MTKMTSILQVTFEAAFLLCVAIPVLSLTSSHAALRGTEILQKFPKEKMGVKLLEIDSDDGEDNKSAKEDKTQHQKMRPPLVIKLLKEKIDTNPVSNHLGTYFAQSPAPFAFPEVQLYHPHSATIAPEQPEPQLSTRQLEETSVEDLKQPPPKYQYIYKVKDPDGNDFGHTEARVGDRTWGRYFVQLPDGREKTVRYWADDSGFHAEVVYT